MNIQFANEAINVSPPLAKDSVVNSSVKSQSSERVAEMANWINNANESHSILAELETDSISFVLSLSLGQGANYCCQVHAPHFVSNASMMLSFWSHSF